MIVCMSRRICVDLYNEIVKLRPSWHGENDDAGVMKIVMTGSATDGPDWQQHIRDKRRREALGKRFKDAKDPFKVVIVRDMWLTGFDVPSLHTMYVDKPMRGHGLMQAIARVNRVFKDKPGGPLQSISETMAHQNWPDQNPLGKHVQMGRPEAAQPFRTIVTFVQKLDQKGDVILVEIYGIR